MNGQQIAALKAPYAHNTKVGTTPPKSPAAVHGATSAFLPKSATSTTSITNASVGALFAASAAGKSVQRRAESKSPERSNATHLLQIPRGRQLYPDNRQSPHETSSLLPTKQLKGSERFSIQTRSSSTLAAQRATAQSRSPQRNPVIYRDSNEISARPHRPEHVKGEGTDALLGATVSMAASSARERSPVMTPPIKSRIMNFEKLPTLPNSGIGGTRDVYKRDTATSNSRSLASTAHSSLIRSTSDHPAQPPHTKNHCIIPLAPTILSRQFSEDSTISSEPPTTSDVGGLESRSGNGNDLLSTSLIPRLSQSKSPPQAIAKDYQPSMTVNALADAMVASSLASSRAVSPSKLAPPPPRRRSRSVATLYDSISAFDGESQKKKTKPQHSMKHTLRQQIVSDNEEVDLVKRGRRHWMRKHPHKYSEGDRKRWRDKVTERERKRYEGVFAANRGLLFGTGHFTPTPAALSDNATVGNQIINVVVRDIWERSRLPREVLREIYDLVCPEETNMLSREEFVVGLWLIDQRLKGRKLPVKVSSSVWASVRHSQGIKIRNHGP